MSQLSAQAIAAQPKLDESATKGIRAILVTVAVSLGLGVVKVVAGAFGHSYALVADGVESLLDVVSGLAVAGSLKLAAQPPDEEYPYGYGKVEPTAALVIAAGIFVAAIIITIQSVREIRNPLEAPAAFKLVVLIPVVVVKSSYFASCSAPASRLRARRCRPMPGTIAAIRSLRWRRLSGY